MSRDDLISVEGVVIDVLAGGSFSIQLQNGQIITSKLSGRMRKNQIRVIRGDRVTIGISPYDLTHGLILSRERVSPSGGGDSSKSQKQK